MIAFSIVLGVVVYGWRNIGVSEREIEVPSFNSIYAEAPVYVYVQPGNQDAVIIRADNKVHDKMTIEVVDSQLRIFNHEHIRGERVLDVYVTYRALDSITAAGASTVISRSMLDADNFKLVAHGASEVKLQINCRQLDLEMLRVANVFLAGNADVFNFNIDAFGDLTAYNFKALKCKATMITGDQSPGIARINVLEELDVHIEGPRYLYYRGDPEITNKVIKGRSKLVKK